MLTAAETDALMLSLRVGIWCVVGTLPPGIAMAWLLARREFYGKNLLNGVLHLPLVLPPVAIGYLMLMALGRNGPLGAWLSDTLGISVAFTWQGAVVASAVMAFPLMVRSVRLSLECVDRRLEAAARTLGRGSFRIFMTITLPLIVPGILTGAILAFARSLGEFGATITFVSNIEGETRTLPLALYTMAQTPDGESGSMRLAAISVALAMAALFASEITARKLQHRLGG
ncbi:MAG: molybdate ABC transporter permease subunit [Rhodospirillales bacterium]|nr:molybdate ABC transporter permease subunit [Rhodospirillales bacterium]